MRMIEAVKACLRNYAKFSGRASRPEYWWFVLFVFAASIVLAVVDSAVFGLDPETGQVNTLLTNVFQVAMFLPALGAGWRRMHDSGRPGWYLLLPMGVSILFTVALVFGVVVFGFAESQGADADGLLGPATALGVTGLIAFAVVQLAILVLVIWWLTRPSDEAENAYGPPSTF